MYFMQYLVFQGIEDFFFFSDPVFLRIKYVVIVYQNQLPWKYNLLAIFKKEIEIKKDKIFS